MRLSLSNSQGSNGQRMWRTCCVFLVVSSMDGRVLVRRVDEESQELAPRAFLSESRRRWSERFGILPKTGPETPGSTPSRHTGTSFSAGEPRTSRDRSAATGMYTDGPEAAEGLMRSDAGADRHAVVNSDAAPVAGDDGDDDEEDPMFPLPSDDDGDRDLSLPRQANATVTGMEPSSNSLHPDRLFHRREWVHSTLSRQVSLSMHSFVHLTAVCLQDQLPPVGSWRPGHFKGVRGV